MRSATVLLLVIGLAGCSVPPQNVLSDVDQPDHCARVLTSEQLSERLGMPFVPMEDAGVTGDNVIQPPEAERMRCAYAVDLDDEPDVVVTVKVTCAHEPVEAEVRGRPLSLDGASAVIEASDEDPRGIHRVVGRDANCGFSVMTSRLTAQQAAVVTEELADGLSRRTRPVGPHSPRRPLPAPVDDERIGRGPSVD